MIYILIIVTDFDYNCPHCDNSLEHQGNGLWKCVSCDFSEQTNIVSCKSSDCSNLIYNYDDSQICEECSD